MDQSPVEFMVVGDDSGLLTDASEILGDVGGYMMTAALHPPPPPNPGEAAGDLLLRWGSLFAAQHGCPMLVEVQSLQVHALGGSPGEHLHTWLMDPREDLAPRSSDVELCTGILGLMRTHNKKARRFACLVSSVALVLPNGTVVEYASGDCHGHIVDEMRGRDCGGPYSRIFAPGPGATGNTLTLAQMELAERQQYCPRRKALTHLRNALVQNRSAVATSVV